MSKSEKFAVGVDLGGTNIKIGIVSEGGKIYKKISLKTNASKGSKEVVKNIKNGIKQILTGNKFKISGIGIGSPGVVNIENGTVENPPNFPGWTKVNLVKILQKEFKHKIHVENDANVAALGEMIFGAGKKHNSFIMVTLGTGVGGGIVIDKKIFHGEFGAAGEIGHVTIDYKGPLCNCGSYGCIETFVGNHYLVNSVKLQLQSRKDSSIWKILNNNLDQLTPRIIQEAAEDGDEFSNEIIKSMGNQLGAVFASVSNLFDIRTYIIGGGVAGFGKPLFKSILESVTKRVLKPLKGSIKVIPAKLKNDAGIKGASALVFYRSA
jgi:glucokinase